jgi:proline dehydrogenase
MDTEYTITSIVEEAPDGQQYGATVNGRHCSGFSSDSKGENGRIYQAIQEAIDDGATVEPYVEYVPSPLDLLAQTDSELIRLAARQIEDILVEREAAGQYVPATVMDKIAERQSLRSQI